MLEVVAVLCCAMVGESEVGGEGVKSDSSHCSRVETERERDFVNEKQESRIKRAAPAAVVRGVVR